MKADYTNLVRYCTHLPQGFLYQEDVCQLLFCSTLKSPVFLSTADLLSKQRFTLKNSSFVLSFSHSQISDFSDGFLFYVKALLLLFLLQTFEGWPCPSFLLRCCVSVSSSPPVFCKMNVLARATCSYLVYSLYVRLRETSEHDILGVFLSVFSFFVFKMTANRKWNSLFCSAPCLPQAISMV